MIWEKMNEDWLKEQMIKKANKEKKAPVIKRAKQQVKGRVNNTYCF